VIIWKQNKILLSSSLTLTKTAFRHLKNTLGPVVQKQVSLTLGCGKSSTPTFQQLAHKV
jgi:hypothetical protein